MNDASDPRPVWSEPFMGEALAGLARDARLAGIDRGRAFGGATGRGVTVCIIDSGVEADHPALAGRVRERVAVELEHGKPNVVGDEAGDPLGHGTACGGLIVALAPEVEIVLVRVLGTDLQGRGAAFLAGLEWAFDRGGDIVNLSLSSRSESLFADFHEVADRGYFGGISLVSAANNTPVASHPSLFSSVISVAAREEPDPWRWYYDPRPRVEFGAWGVNVPIAWRDALRGQGRARGHSRHGPAGRRLTERLSAV